MLTRGDIQKGVLNSTDQAANDVYNNDARLRAQKNAQDAALSQLITGKNMDATNQIAGKEFDEAAGQRNITANTARVRAEMLRNGVDPSKASMNFNESGGSFNPDPDTFGKGIKKAMLDANITGYNVANPSVIPSSKDAEEVKNATGGLKTLQGTGASLQEKLKNAQGLDRFGSMRIPFTDKQIGTDAGVGIESDLTAMKLQQKELDKLGALSGPDMRLIDDAFGSVTGIGALFGDKGSAAKKIQAVLDRAKQRVSANATSRGYAPQPGYLDEPAGASPQGAPKAMSFEEWKAAKGR